MTKEQQDLAWTCLTKEVREKIRKEYYLSKVSAYVYTTPSWQTLEWLYGSHNLTSDTEPEEMLMVDRESCDDYKSKQPYIQVEPKFKVGDKVEIIDGDKTLVEEIHICNGEIFYKVKGYEALINENNLEPSAEIKDDMKAS